MFFKYLFVYLYVENMSLTLSTSSSYSSTKQEWWMEQLGEMDALSEA